MTKRLLVVLAVLALSTPILALTGKVIDQNGKPVPNATVDIVQTMRNQELVANENGEVAYSPMGSAVTLRVADRDGKPLVGAKVTTLSMWNGFTGKARSNKKGRFNIALPKEKTVWFGIRAIDSTGKPASGATLTLESVEGKKWSITMNDKGEYLPPRREDAPENIPMEYRLTATADNRTYASASYSVGSPEPVFKLYPAHKYVARVVDEAGKPIKGATVKINSVQVGFGGVNMSAHAWTQEALSTLATAADGSFPIQHIPDFGGKDSAYVRLSVSQPGSALINKELNAKDLVKGPVINLPLECKLEGVAYVPGKSGHAPKGTALLVQIPSGQRWETRPLKVGENGRFELAQLPPGKATVLAEPRRPEHDIDGEVTISQPMPWAMPAAELTLSPDHPNKVELVAETGSVMKGKVVEKATGMPIPRAHLQVKSRASSQDQMDRTTADSDGSFAVRVPSGPVTITVEGFDVGHGSYTNTGGGEAPVTLTAHDGKDVSDVVAFATKNAEGNSRTPTAKDILPGFELKAGTYDLVWDPELAPRDLYTDCNRDAKPYIKKLPELKSKEPAYLAFRFDGPASGFLLAAADKVDGEIVGYIDANRNGDLSDDQPLKWKPGGEGEDTYSPWVEVQSHQGAPGSQQTQNPISVRLNIYANEFETVTAEQKGGWKTMVDSSTGKVQFVLLDTNNNGVYNDKLSADPGINYGTEALADNAYIDDTGFGHAAIERDCAHRMQLGKVSMLAGELYVVDVVSAGSTISIQPYTGATSEISVKAGAIPGFKAAVTSFSVATESGTYSSYNAKPLTVPSGAFRISQYGLNLEGTDATRYGAICSVPTKSIVEPGKSAEVRVGGKLSLLIRPNEKNLVLNAGKESTIHYAAKIGSAPAFVHYTKGGLVTLRILDGAGKELYRNSEKDDGPWIKLKTPDLKPGVYKMEVMLGPIRGSREVRVEK